MKLESMLLLVGTINFAMWLIAAAFFFLVRKIPFYHLISFYLAYHFLGFVARPFIASMPEASVLWDYIGFDYSNRDLLFSCLATNCALIAFTIGSTLATNGTKVENPIPVRTFLVHRKVAFAFACAAFACISVISIKTHGPGLSLDRNSYEVEMDESGAQRMVEVSGYQTSLENLFVGVLIMLIILYRFNFLTFAMFLPWLCYRMFVGTGRWSFFLPLIAIGALAAWHNKRQWPSIKFVVLGVIMLFIFNIIGGNRDAVRLLVSGEYKIKDILDEHQERRGRDFGLSDFQEFEIATFAYSVIPSKTGWNYGSQYLRLLVWPIPRQLWPDKPVFTSRINLNTIGNAVGLSWSMHADFYSILGLPSLICCMGLVGFFVQTFYSYAVSTKSIYGLAAYWIFLMESPQWFRDGGVTIVYFFLMLYASIWICLWIGKVKMTWRPSRVMENAA